jgi:hypothetical protein
MRLWIVFFPWLTIMGLTVPRSNLGVDPDFLISMGTLYELVLNF